MHFTENLYAFRRNLMNLASNQDNFSFCRHDFAVVSLAYHERRVVGKTKYPKLRVEKPLIKL